MLRSCLLLSVPLLLTLATTPIARAAESPDAKALAFFEEQVRPLLVEHCYRCHSASSKTVEGNLRLDSKAGWQKGGDSGPAIVPGKPAESLVLKAVTYEDTAMQMPPSGKLPAEVIDTFRQWIALGAPDPRIAETAGPKKRSIDLAKEQRHWAYQPLAHPRPPEPRDPSWARTPVDRFILARLEEHKLKPNTAIDRRRLIRRVYFDLLGVPPAPEEVDAFVGDPSPDAYERLLDRLLARPEYGERWGRHWLDLARFAESHGFEQDYDRPNAWHYRDFVIRALNADLPYDTFIRWQIAGDELASDNPEAWAATGFLAAGVHATQITANQAEKERYDELDDMTRTIGTTVLGLTIGCARCHDHKFDPLSSEEYYRLVSTFTTTVRSDYDVSLDAVGDRERQAAFDKIHRPMVEARAKVERDEAPRRLASLIAAKLETLSSPLTPGPSPARGEWRLVPDWTVLDLTLFKADGGTKFKPLADGSQLASGSVPKRETLEFRAALPARRITAVRLEAREHESLPAGGPGRGPRGEFKLRGLSLQLVPAEKDQKPVSVALTNPTIFAESGPLTGEASAKLDALLDGKGATTWASGPLEGARRSFVFALAKPLEVTAGQQLSITLMDTGESNSLGRVRVSVASAEATPDFAGTEARLPALAVLDKLARDPSAKLDEAQRQLALDWVCANDREWRTLDRQEREHARTAPKPHVEKMLVSSEGVPAVRLHTQGPDFYDKTFMLTRGDPNMKKAEVTPGFLRVLTNHPDGERHWEHTPAPGSRTSHRREALADWLVDVDHGAGALAARVIVNRLWHYHLGRGIVATPSDFGTQGDPPSHPELLEWLADRLVSEGWRLKPLHKLIMLSGVYMQGTAGDPAREKLDLENRWLWRRDLERLDAEAIRDALLATSGQLDRTMFGPGSLDLAQNRRSIYFFIKRSKLVPMMMLFDSPDPTQDMARRPTTTVAPQALMLLNAPAVRAQAEAFARRLLAEAAKAGHQGDATWIVDRAYRLALSRGPVAAEMSESVEFLRTQTADYASSAKAEPSTVALADFCQILYSVNEFVYVE